MGTLIEGLDWPGTVAFFVVLPILASAFPVLDTIIKEQVPFGVACRAKEFWFLWVIYALVAVAAILALHTKKELDSPDIFSFLGVLLGFPMLLQSKLFSLRTSEDGPTTAVGFEYVLITINHLAIPGMKASVDEFMAELQERWLALGPEKLSRAITNYLSSRVTSEEKDNLLKWVDDTLKDAINTNNLTERNRNLRTLFAEVRKAGGPRGVIYVINHSK